MILTNCQYSGSTFRVDELVVPVQDHGRRIIHDIVQVDDALCQNLVNILIFEIDCRIVSIVLIGRTLPTFSKYLNILN
jgi:hypothetical protein